MTKEETAKQPEVTLTADKAGTPQTKTFTSEEHEKALRDVRSAALAEAGKMAAESKRSLTLAQEAHARLNKVIEEQHAREIEAAQGDPQILSGIMEKHKRWAVESELSNVKSELSQKEERIQQYEAERAEEKRTQTVQKVSDRYNVDPVRLAKLAKHTDGSIEEIEDLAKDMPSATGNGKLKPDPGTAIGGALSREQIIANFIKTPRDLSAKEAYMELRRKEGR